MAVINLDKTKDQLQAQLTTMREFRSLLPLNSPKIPVLIAMEETLLWVMGRRGTSPMTVARGLNVRVKRPGVAVGRPRNSDIQTVQLTHDSSLEQLG